MPTETRCGVERWAVKTLTDPAAGAVNPTPRNTTVFALTQRKVPVVTDSTPRLPGVERTTYQVRARLVGFKREDDSDIHLVIADLKQKNATMIVEFPDSSCTQGAPPAARKTMSVARSIIVGSRGAPTRRWRTLGGTAVFTGVGFVDKIHGQTGVAPNGIELHPVTGVSQIPLDLS